MQKFLLAILMLTVSGCAIGPSSPALCAGTEASRKAHAGALSEDGGPLSVMTGRTLIARIDAGCAK